MCVVLLLNTRSEARRKAREEKIKPIRPQNEMLSKMERLLDQRKAERRQLEAELQIGQEAGVSQQRLNKLSANRVTFSSWQLFMSACR